MKVLSVFGTRPEAIKFAPVLSELANTRGVESIVCVTGQHREMLDQVIDIFKISPDYDLDLMHSNQQLHDIFSGILKGVTGVIEKVKPDWVLVQGDTTTTIASAMAAYLKQVKVGHIEAGLRTGNKWAPFPEEMNRRLTSSLADLHFAPTEKTKEHLIAENIPERMIKVTGNTVIDAIEHTSGRIDSEAGLSQILEDRFAYLDKSKPLVLVTGHRRENFGQGFKDVCMALKEIAGRFPGVELLYAVHLNPMVRKPVRDILGDIAGVGGVDSTSGVILIEPVDYLSFVYLLKRAFLVLTDSGGIQEEAPALGKPVLVMREVTERQEAIESGTAKLVGTNTRTIVDNVAELITSKKCYDSMANAINPYGDGLASKRIVEYLLEGSTGDVSDQSSQAGNRQ